MDLNQLKKELMNSHSDAPETERAYLDDLNQAHISAQKALEALSKPEGPKRGIMYRMRLGRAQNALISLYVRDLARKKDW